MGRPRKSDQQHELEGTYRPERHDGTGGPAEDAPLEKPKDLNAWESEYWDQHYRPWMKGLDFGQFRRLVWVAWLVEEARRRYEKNPYDKDARMALVQLGGQQDKLAAEFGLSTSARAKLPKMGPEQKDDDERFFGPRIAS